MTQPGRHDEPPSSPARPTLRPSLPAVATAQSVQVCDGCCCGTARKHPDVDHVTQQACIAEATEAGGGRFHVVGCLDQCHASNVVFVRRGAQRIWLGQILTPAVTDELCTWLAAGPSAPLPAGLRPHRFLPLRDAASERSSA